MSDVQACSATAQGYLVQVSTVYPNSDMHIQTWFVPFEVADQIFTAIPADAPKLLDVLMPNQPDAVRDNLRNMVASYLIGNI